MSAPLRLNPSAAEFKPAFLSAPSAPAPAPAPAAPAEPASADEVDDWRADRAGGSPPRRSRHIHKERLVPEAALEPNAVKVTGMKAGVDVARVVAMFEERFGKVAGCDFSGVSFGIVRFQDAESANTAIRFSNTTVLGVKLVITPASTAECSGVATPASDAAEPSSGLVLKNLPFDATKETLEAFLTGLDAMPESTNVLKAASGGCKGVAFLKYGSPDEATMAIAAIAGQEFKGRRLRVEYVRPNNPTTSTTAKPSHATGGSAAAAAGAGSRSRGPSEDWGAESERARSRGDSMSSTGSGASWVEQRRARSVSNSSTASNTSTSSSSARYARGPDGGKGFQAVRTASFSEPSDSSAAPAPAPAPAPISAAATTPAPGTA